jgi:hypothetical protein
VIGQCPDELVDLRTTDGPSEAFHLNAGGNAEKATADYRTRSIDPAVAGLACHRDVGETQVLQEIARKKLERPRAQTKQAVLELSPHDE